jgi:hypothetical protein
MRAVVVVTACAAMLAAVFSQPATGAEGGVRGVLRLSHGCPGPVREGDERDCSFPAAGVLVRAFARGTTVVAGADRTDRHGRFSIALAPGRYLLRVTVPNARTEPKPVAVRAAAWTTVRLRYLVPPFMA